LLFSRDKWLSLFSTKNKQIRRIRENPPTWLSSIRSKFSKPVFACFILKTGRITCSINRTVILPVFKVKHVKTQLENIKNVQIWQKNMGTGRNLKIPTTSICLFLILNRSNHLFFVRTSDFSCLGSKTSRFDEFGKSDSTSLCSIRNRFFQIVIFVYFALKTGRITCSINRTVILPVFKSKHSKTLFENVKIVQKWFEFETYMYRKEF
jgi:hypothetical protein